MIDFREKADADAELVRARNAISKPWQIKFADEYYKTGNAKRSYMAVRPKTKERTAESNGAALAKNTEIIDYLEAMGSVERIDKRLSLSTVSNYVSKILATLDTVKKQVIVYDKTQGPIEKPTEYSPTEKLELLKFARQLIIDENELDTDVNISVIVNDTEMLTPDELNSQYFDNSDDPATHALKVHDDEINAGMDGDNDEAK